MNILSFYLLICIDINVPLVAGWWAEWYSVNGNLEERE